MSKLSQCTHRGIEEENIVSLSYLDHLISMDFFFDLVLVLGVCCCYYFVLFYFLTMKRHSAFTFTTVIDILYEIFKAIIKKSLN